VCTSQAIAKDEGRVGPLLVSTRALVCLASCRHSTASGVVIAGAWGRGANTQGADGAVLPRQPVGASISQARALCCAATRDVRGVTRTIAANDFVGVAAVCCPYWALQSRTPVLPRAASVQVLVLAHTALAR